jgi:hypothetical protein
VRGGELVLGPSAFGANPDGGVARRRLRLKVDSVSTSAAAPGSTSINRSDGAGSSRRLSIVNGI